MGISTHVIGFKAPDDKWKAMKVIYDACSAAGIAPPEEVSKYFEWDTPDDQGVEVKLQNTLCCAKWSRDMYDGFEIDVRKLPADVTHIRFFNSY